MSRAHQKPEPAPTHKAAVRLLAHIFAAAPAAPEFQRQLATPNVPKYSAALLALALAPHTAPDLQARHSPRAVGAR